MVGQGMDAYYTWIPSLICASSSWCLRSVPTLTSHLANVHPSSLSTFWLALYAFMYISPVFMNDNRTHIEEPFGELASIHHGHPIAGTRGPTGPTHRSDHRTQLLPSHDDT